MGNEHRSPHILLQVSALSFLPQQIYMLNGLKYKLHKKIVLSASFVTVCWRMSSISTWPNLTRTSYKVCLKSFSNIPHFKIISKKTWVYMFYCEKFVWLELRTAKNFTVKTRLVEGPTVKVQYSKKSYSKMFLRRNVLTPNLPYNSAVSKSLIIPQSYTFHHHIPAHYSKQHPVQLFL